MTSIGRGKRPRRVHELGTVGDAHEHPGHRRDDLLAGEGTASALDHGERGRHFIGTVDVDRQFRDAVEIDERDSERGEAFRRRLGAGDRTGDPAPVSPQGIDEVVGRGARTDPDHGACRDVIHHIGRGGFRDGLLQLVLIHECPRKARPVPFVCEG